MYESSISTGSGYFCAISARSQVYCWGTDPETGESILEPKVVPAADVEFVSIGLGVRYLCALSINGIVYCKGGGYNGELGTGVDKATLQDLTVPVQQDDMVFKSLSVGYYHACSIDTNNSLYCWGDNEYGQLGVRDIERSNVPVKVGENFKQVSAGGEHTCAVTLTNKGYCWGRNDLHQSSPSDAFTITSPMQVDGSWGSFHAGYDYTLAINTEGDGYGWGMSEGIAGDSAAGGFLGQGREFCLDLNSGKVQCKPENGSTASGVLTYEQYPTKIRGGKKWLSFAAGRVPCGIEKDSRSLYCWGYTAGEAYAVGSPGTNVPVLISGKRWEDVSSGISGARCAITIQGEAYCWGRNVFDCGETCPLGDGTVKNSAKPSKVKSDGLWRASKAPSPRTPGVDELSTLSPSLVALPPALPPVEIEEQGSNTSNSGSNLAPASEAIASSSLEDDATSFPPREQGLDNVSSSTSLKAFRRDIFVSIISLLVILLTI